MTLDVEVSGIASVAAGVSPSSPPLVHLCGANSNSVLMFKAHSALSPRFRLCRLLRFLLTGQAAVRLYRVTKDAGWTLSGFLCDERCLERVARCSRTGLDSEAVVPRTVNEGSRYQPPPCQKSELSTETEFGRGEIIADAVRNLLGIV